jgi:hypothetical protein
MEDNHPDATDDLARAALLRIVPSGYRLIDEHDERFTGIREKFVRLALKHLGGKPSLVGFVDAGVDAQEAARAAAAWAAQNLTPSAIQRRVDPGVLVIAVNGAATAGPVPGAAVSSAVWTVAPDGRVETRGRPPGSPSPGLVKDVVHRLQRGEPAPGIGQVDYVERNLMHGRGRRARAAGLSGTAILLIVLGIFFGLRFVPAIFAGATRPQQSNGPCNQGCTIITPAQNGQTLGTIPVGGASGTFLFRGATSCPVISDTNVLQQASCDQVGGTESGVAATYQGEAAGSARLTVNAGSQGFTITILVR